MSTQDCAQTLPLFDLFARDAALPPLGAAASMRKRLDTGSSENGSDEPSQFGLALPALPLNTETWSDNEILGILDRTLTQQLAVLADGRTSKELRVAILEWVATPLRREVDRKNPFSFGNCCYAAGVDPEEMQELVLARFAPEYLLRVG